MKLKVNRKLDSGRYFVDFTATDFTTDEVIKMASFGIPAIDLQFHNQMGAQIKSKIPLNKVSPQFKAAFTTEQEAVEYQEKVVSQIREAMRVLRERKDDFSSDEEVEV